MNGLISPFIRSDLSTNFKSLTCPLHDYWTWSLTSWAPQFQLLTGFLFIAFSWFILRTFRFRISYLRSIWPQWFIFLALRSFVLSRNFIAELILMFTWVKVRFVMIWSGMEEPWTAEYSIVLMFLFEIVFIQENKLFRVFIFPLPLKAWQKNHSNKIQLTYSHPLPLRRVNFKTH